MSGDVHVRFCERLEGKFLGATRLKSRREPMPHRGLRLWLREDPASPRPTGERARAACRDNSNFGKASPPGFILEWVYDFSGGYATRLPRVKIRPIM
jgi:hypothetical protein